MSRKTLQYQSASCGQVYASRYVPKRLWPRGSARNANRLFVVRFVIQREGRHANRSARSVKLASPIRWRGSGRFRSANLILGSASDAEGTIGTSNVVLTVQNTGTESGCVSWIGFVDIIGSTACPAGLSPVIVGGNEKTGVSQTQTRTVADTGVSSGDDLVVVLSPLEGASSFTVENLSLTIYAPTGAVLFNSGDLAGPSDTT